MSLEQNFALFETAIGPCAIAWTGRGVIGVQIHERDAAATRSRIMRRFPAAKEAPPSSELQHAIDGIIALLRGEPRDLTDIEIDNTETPEFNARVYAVARTVPPGQTMTYGEIAERLGDKLLAREVGQALGQNPCPIVMPCHRVLAAGGKASSFKTGGFSAPGGVATKMRLLSIEGAQPGGPTLFDRLPLIAARRKRN
jgi:methylated-DNA-[protein]-cysteine S-methyltransferase